MKKLEDFLNDLKNDEKLRKEFEQTTDQKQAANLLKKKGYDVSEEELTELYLESVSGGFLDVTKTEWSATQNVNVDGSENIVSISGNQTLGYNYGGAGGENKNKPLIDPTTVLQIMFGNR